MDQQTNARRDGETRDPGHPAADDHEKRGDQGDIGSDHGAALDRGERPADEVLEPGMSGGSDPAEGRRDIGPTPSDDPGSNDISR